MIGSDSFITNACPKVKTSDPLKSCNTLWWLCWLSQDRRLDRLDLTKWYCLLLLQSHWNAAFLRIDVFFSCISNLFQLVFGETRFKGQVLIQLDEEVSEIQIEGFKESWASSWVERFDRRCQREKFRLCSLVQAIDTVNVMLMRKAISGHVLVDQLKRAKEQWEMLWIYRAETAFHKIERIKTLKRFDGLAM